MSMINWLFQTPGVGYGDESEYEDDYGYDDRSTNHSYQSHNSALPYNSRDIERLAEQFVSSDPSLVHDQPADHEAAHVVCGKGVSPSEEEYVSGFQNAVGSRFAPPPSRSPEYQQGYQFGRQWAQQHPDSARAFQRYPN